MAPCPVATAIESALAAWPQGGLLVAFSGGGDSSVLLHALAQSHAARERGLHALHVDHGLQRDSARWAGHCAEAARALGVALTVVRVHVDGSGGIEAAARNARYAALGAALQPGAILLTAHHADDQAETVLLRLMRGSGAVGLAAMRELRPFAAGLLGRPLLGIARAELLTYARANGIASVEDPSNRDTARERNFVRHEVLPLLRSRWPHASSTLALSARLAAAGADAMARETQAALARARAVDERTLRIDVLGELDAVMRGAVLRAWLVALGHAAPGAQVVDEVERTLLGAREDAQPCIALNGVELRRYRALLHAIVPVAAPPPDWSARWDARSSLELPAGAGTLALSRALPLDFDVSFRRGGERIRLAPSRPSQSLRNLLQELGVPPWERVRIPLLRRDGELVAAGDVLLADALAQHLRAADARLCWAR